jgi:hypothetical protein
MKLQMLQLIIMKLLMLHHVILGDILNVLMVGL